MATTTTQIMAWAIAACGDRDDISDADQLAMYNRTQRMVNRLANLRVTQTFDTTSIDTVDGEYEVVLPPDVKTLRTLRLEDGTLSRKLIMVTPRWMDRKHAKPDGSSYEGRAIYFCRRNNTSGEDTVFIWPVADAAYDLWIDYYKWFSDQADGDNVNFTNIDDVLVEGLKFHFWSHIGEESRAAVSLAKFHTLLNDAVKAERDKIDLEFEAEPFEAVPSSHEQGHLDPWVHSL